MSPKKNIEDYESESSESRENQKNSDVSEEENPKSGSSGSREKQNSDASGEENFNEDDEAESSGSRQKRKKQKISQNARDLEQELKEELEQAFDLNQEFNSSVVDALATKGITSLLPEQSVIVRRVQSGLPLGCKIHKSKGKTLAYILAILKRLFVGTQEKEKNYRNSPRGLVLLPTKNLADQVFEQLNFYGELFGLTSCCLYPGSAYGPQQKILKGGVDIVIGTPKRVRDHITSKNLVVTSLEVVVLDEADEMHRMNLVKDVDFVLAQLQQQLQVLIFTATLPFWVKHVFYDCNIHIHMIDLVGAEKRRSIANVREILLPCPASARLQLISDIITFYSRGGKTIIFTETEDSADDLVATLPSAHALHGVTLSTSEAVEQFNAGAFKTLVVTNNVMDLNNTDADLIIQYEPPCEADTYIHHSGYTMDGVVIMLYDPEHDIISTVESEWGVKFERVRALQPIDVANVVANSMGLEMAEKLSIVSNCVIPAFKTAAEDLVSSSCLSPLEVLAKVLANQAGYREIKSRSLLTSLENYVTLQLEAEQECNTLLNAGRRLKRCFSTKHQLVKDVTLRADGRAILFDVPANEVSSFLEGLEETRGTIKVVEELPLLLERRPIMVHGVELLLESHQSECGEISDVGSGNGSRGSCGGKIGGRGRRKKSFRKKSKHNRFRIPYRGY